MSDYIKLQKIRTEPDFTELKVVAQNPVISATAKIYVTAVMLEELQEQIQAFLSEKDLEGYWENDVPGIGGPPCVTMKFLPQPQEAGALIEIYMELNDGGSFMDHHCRFYVGTSRQALKQFAEELTDFLQDESRSQMVLS